MTPPPAIAARLIDAAARELAAVMREEIAASQLLTLQQAADLLGVSKPTARKLCREVVILGEASDRIRLSSLKRIIESRTVKA